MIRRSVIFVLLLSASIFIAPTISLANQNNSILDAAGRSKASMEMIPEWDRVFKNYKKILSTPSYGRTAKWDEFVEKLQNDDPVRQILKVNLWFNGYPYKQDNWTYGKDDHWATPSEFLQHGGDCEDFVIIKYLTLRRLGFSAEDMKLTMVYDVFSGTDHALLIVNYDEQTYVLDNRDNMTIEDHYSERYTPHYAFNENELWTYDNLMIVHKARKNNGDLILPGNR